MHVCVHVHGCASVEARSAATKREYNYLLAHNSSRLGIEGQRVGDNMANTVHVHVQ